ncbi:MAG TPA: zf-HC2 domain-containing protein [Terriglobales bacterium]|nr:zf-HC2 domain-containing protein [Terriglobales bacterium]
MEKIDQYVDAELAAKEQTAFDEHVKTCPRCSLEALDRFKVKQAVQIAGHRFAPSTEFRDRIQSQISGKKVATRRNWIPALIVVAAMLTVFAVSAIMMKQRLERQRLLAEIADIHVSNLAASSPVDVVSTDRHTVKPWFQGKIPFTFNLPDLNGSEFSLVGGRVVYLQHEPAALLVFKYRNHYLSVFVLRNTPSISAVGAVGTEEASFTTKSWASNGLRYIVITDAGPAQAKALTELLKTAAKS